MKLFLITFNVLISVAMMYGAAALSFRLYEKSLSVYSYNDVSNIKESLKLISITIASFFIFYYIIFNYWI